MNDSHPGSAVDRTASSDTGRAVDENEDHRIDWRQYQPDLTWICEAKAEEFRLLGYEKVTGPQVWECAVSRIKGRVALHDLVGTVLGLQVQQFMTFTTMNAYKGAFGDGSFDLPNRG